MRSQLLIEIEKFGGTVIFATNLAENYDRAVVTRIRSIYFKKPDELLHRKLWDKMLLNTLPLNPDINLDALAAIDDICGRDIKNAVIKAAIMTAINNDKDVSQKVLEDAINSIIQSNKEVLHSQQKKLS
jgi:AAA+ superfamily predicted ATPase